MAQKGRPKRTALDVMSGYSYGPDGKPFLPPGRRIASRDHIHFIGTRVGEIWVELCAPFGGLECADADDLYDQALEQAAQELAKLAHSKGTYWPRKPGRRPGNRLVQNELLSEDNLRRAYSKVRPTISSSGNAFGEVARRLWIRNEKYRNTLPSLHALRVRIMRAMKRVERN